MNRRSFLKRSIFAAGALSTGSLFAKTEVVKIGAQVDKLRCVQIGCGSRGMSHLTWLLNENLVAIVDPDEARHEVVKKFLKENGQDPAKLQLFTDYRRMFDKIGKEIDVVTIATPNHHHAPAAMLAMDLNVGVFCEKPLCHSIAEARKLREMARHCKAPTQMGNQGHCMEGYRRLYEFIKAGVVGNIKETHSWTDRANGGVGPRPNYKSPPSTLHWDEWIGPAPYRDFHDDLHPHEWHGWYDFGNGSLGNMGCHVLDGVYWALNVQHPESFELEEVRGGSNERYPMGSRIRFDVPSRGELPAFKAYWYEGLKSNATDQPQGTLRTARGAARNLPPLLAELRKQYPDEEFDTSGTLYVGEKGILYTGTYGDKMHILPIEKMESLVQPPKILPRPKNVLTDLLDARRSGTKETAASFEYGAQLTEFTLLGNLAQRAGIGKKIQWNGRKMKTTNFKELNEFVKTPYRKGWRV